ncbi:formate dehydrogenase subunit delta [Nonomuraea jiangxiensis]|uniref:Formate dehydrogenase subunit delta n=1 Tax=Nonomuraea jiangxiensis TaxID=633440 RepID=A0A1G8LZ71_9ACTN|nr:formate dehydrogenase subunit delta [Nonomuraea jiangxiensis]SDI60989.1 formate dehydrogenase subunit delta [Nonomuraea jiangxiensis]
MTATHTPPHIRMSNEIAVQFRNRDPAWAAEQIAAHIHSFWDPRMRARLLADVTADDDRLDPLIVAAAALLPPARANG